MPASGWKKMSSEEIRLANKWYNDDCMPPSEIAEQLGRDKSVITRLLVKQVPRKKQGRPQALTDAQAKFLKNKLDQLVRKANCKYTITAKMLLKATRLKVSERCVRDCLHKDNIYFRALREKPVLTKEDMRARLVFARKYHLKTRAWWNKALHASIDGKYFKAYLTGDARVRAAQHATYGAYRAPGKGLEGGYVKPKKTLQYNTGHANILIIAGVGGGKVIMWHNVIGGRWSGQAAADMYSGPLHNALAKNYRTMSRFTVLEDNDPTGFKSKKGIKAKTDSKIDILVLPKRSPDLNVLDYSIWKEVNRRLRRQERAWPRRKRESRADYVSRLRRTAVRLPRAFLAKSIGDMRRRCQRLLEAKGGFFEEGGKRGC
jgi:transposase